MAVSEQPQRLDEVLEAVGCLGSWDIDYGAEKVRNTGLLPSLYGLTPAQASDGVPLTVTDRTFHPDDLDDVRRARRSPAAITGGRRVMRFRIIDADGRPRWLESHGHVVVDRYGLPVRARGIVMDVTALRLPDAVPAKPSPPLAGLDNLSADLMRAYRSARALGLSDVAGELKPVALRVVRLLGQRFRHASSH